MLANLSTFSIFLVCLVSFGTSSSQAPLDFFDWEASGPFVANGTFSGRSLYPQQTNTTDAPAAIAFDPTNQRYVIQINPADFQFGYENGTYYLLNGVCSFVNKTYTDFVNVYAAAVETTYGLSTECGKVSIFSGLVHEPGACAQSVAMTIVRTDGLAKKLISFSFGQVLNIAPEIPPSQLPPGLPQPPFIPGHVAASLQFNHWVFGEPKPAYFQLPQACWNQSQVLDYCSVYYPVPFFNTPY